MKPFWRIKLRLWLHSRWYTYLLQYWDDIPTYLRNLCFWRNCQSPSNVRNLTHVVKKILGLSYSRLDGLEDDDQKPRNSACARDRCLGERERERERESRCVSEWVRANVLKPKISLVNADRVIHQIPPSNVTKFNSWKMDKNVFATQKSFNFPFFVQYLFIIIG